MALYPNSNIPKPQSFNILSLDGGGVRGVLSATFVERIHNDFPNFLRDVDLIVGTSTGGIQALSLAAGLTPETIKDFYLDKTKKVFADTFMVDLRDVWKLRGADYNNTNLKEIMFDLVGDMKLYELDKKVGIVAFDLDNGLKDPVHRTWKTKVYHNYNGDDSDGEELVVDVALKTSAAPTFFPTYENFCDGGVVANNPALIGVCQALDRRTGLEIRLPDIKVLSLGGGKVNRYIEGEDLDWGVTQWAPHLFHIMMGGAIAVVNFQCSQLLGRRFYRLDPQLGSDFDLDGWKQVPELCRIATELDLEETYEWIEEYWV